MKLIDQGYILDVEKISDPRQVLIFGSLLMLKSGRILAAYRGSSKDSADGNATIFESADQGRTWSMVCDGFNATVGGVAGEIRAAELLEREDGGLTALLSWFDRSRGDKLYDSSTDTVLPAKLLSAESADGGRSWSNYRTLDPGIAGASLTGRILRVRAGDGSGFSRSTRQKRKAGRTCTRRTRGGAGAAGHSSRCSRWPVVPEDKLFYWDQRQALCPRTGRVVSMFWTYNRAAEKDEPISLAWGDPATGKWTAPVSTGIKGQITAPVPLADGRLLAFYVHRHAPGSMRLIESAAGGGTWDTANELVVYQTSAGKERGTDTKSDYGEYWNDMQTWCFGHPVAVNLDARTVLLAYYGGKSNTSLSARWAVVGV